MPTLSKNQVKTRMCVNTGWFSLAAAEIIAGKISVGHSHQPTVHIQYPLLSNGTPISKLFWKKSNASGRGEKCDTGRYMASVEVGGECTTYQRNDCDWLPLFG